ncbi:cation-translocating P-type ATPase [Algoriphagus sp.]|uniref:cation-translocating P-type ATPase n=1 Tax=Algoriphagus sp. TaxID=1872435 RepID=UPI003919E893
MDIQKIKSEDSWHSLDWEKIYSTLSTDGKGLSDSDSKDRLNQFGPNKLPEQSKTTLMKIILHQVLNPLIFILVLAAFASILIGEAKDAVFIFLVILINTGLGTYQEFNAEKSASALQQLMKIKAKIKREGKIKEIDSEFLVPGDLVFLESGMKVPADIRLAEASSLEIDESFLTGESHPSFKKLDLLEKSTGIPDRFNMAFAGATVLSGRGKGLVVETGKDTQVGKIAQNVATGESAKPPLIQRMEKFIKQITLFIVILGLILSFLLRFQGMDLASIFFFVVALAVSAIPEGLPVALTVALSIATRRMAKRNVIVRKLNAVEALGSCTVIASDKTGTLTVNQQTAKEIILSGGNRYEITGEGYNGEGEVRNLENPEPISRLIRVAALANEGGLQSVDGEWTFYGDAMDVALLALTYKTKTTPDDLKNNFPVLGQIPYESERKFSGAFYQVGSDIYFGAKGALETILKFCGSKSQEDVSNILKHADELASNGYRVLAFAEGSSTRFESKEEYSETDIPDLEFLGLVCFIDPLRFEAKDSVEKCKKAGIKVLMITGDHPSTAFTIAQELGIIEKGQTVVTGQMLSEAGRTEDKKYKDLVLSTTVFARVSPVQKLEIVDVLIKNGEFVAVTGDGVNDAPALKRANIGVAMGSGTDVAKEVGSMIVTDDNFSSIVAGVEEGRFAYDNVRKVIFLLISTGAAEVIMFFLSVMMGLPLPLLAVQLLWLNLVTNGIQDVALAFESGEAGAMNKKPRRTTESVFDALMVKQTLVASLTIGLVAFGFWYWLIEVRQMSEYHARDLVLLLMVFMQNFHAFNSRSERVSMFKIPLNRNWILVMGVLAAQGLHILSMQIPFMQSALRIEPITFQEWTYVILLAIPIVAAMELFKWNQRRLETLRTIVN